MLAQTVTLEVEAPVKAAHVRIDVRTLARLIGSRQLSVAEMDALDARSKRLLWKICLDTCLGPRSAK